MLIILSLTAFVASLLTLFSGFGLGTLFLPVAAIFFPVTAAVALTALLHLINNLFKLAVMWRYVHVKVALVFGIPALLATIPGAWLLAKISTWPVWFEGALWGINYTITPVKMLIGFLLIFFATAELWAWGKRVKIRAGMLPLGGILSGFFGGLSGHQGALRSAFLLRAGLSKESFVATGAIIASFVDISRLVVYGISMNVILANSEESLLFIAALAACAGVVVGRLWLKKVTIGFIHKWVAALLYTIGVLLMLGVL